MQAPSSLCYDLVNQMDSRNTVINNLAALISARDSQTKQLTGLFGQGEDFVSKQLSQQIALGDSKIASLTQMLKDGTSNLQTYVQQLQQRDDQIKQLTDAQSTLEGQYQSLFTALINSQQFGGDLTTKISDILNNITPVTSVTNPTSAVPSLTSVLGGLSSP